MEVFCGILLVLLLLSWTVGMAFPFSLGVRSEKKAWEQKLATWELGEFEFCSSSGEVKFNVFTEGEIVERYHKKYPETL